MLFRSYLRVSPAYVESVRSAFGERGQKALLADLCARLIRLGADEPQTMMQDPTDPTLFTAIADWPDSPISRSDDALLIEHAEPVASPPKALPRVGTAIPWDSGLNSDEVALIENALLNEKNPRHLHGIATTLSPWFCVSASILGAKGNLAEKRLPVDSTLARELERQILSVTPTPDRRREITAAVKRLAAALPTIPDSLLREQIKTAALFRVDPDSEDTALREARAVGALLVRPVQVRGHTFKIVCPFAVRIAMPPSEEDGFLSPSALQLALGMQKPKMAKIGQERHIGGRLGGLRAAESLDLNRTLRAHEIKLAKAKSQMTRAEQAIERRRWVDWYRRRKEAGLEV